MVGTCLSWLQKEEESGYVEMWIHTEAAQGDVKGLCPVKLAARPLSVGRRADGPDGKGGAGGTGYCIGPGEGREVAGMQVDFRARLRLSLGKTESNNKNTSVVVFFFQKKVPEKRTALENSLHVRPG